MAPRIPTQSFVFKDLKALSLMDKEFKVYYERIKGPIIETQRNDDKVMEILTDYFDALGVEYVIHRGVILNDSLWVVLILHTN